MRIYFSGIGGAGLEPLAILAKDAGFQVTGSDVSESLNTNELKKQDIEFEIGIQEGKYLQKQHKLKIIDLFVYTSALPHNHPELITSERLGIQTTKRAGLIKLILEQKNLKLLAIAGSHGKTTTTAMCVWVLKELGIPVSYSIGSNISFGHAASFVVDSEWFVYECDEFDRNFLEFNPDISVIVSYDYDHVDTYPTQVSYQEAFQQFINQSGQTFAHSAVAEQFTGVKVPKFDESVYLHMQIKGNHNKRNAQLAVVALHTAFPDISLDILREKINTFPGTQRRFEEIIPNLYSDYAHHPSEIQATIQMANELGKDVVLVYQPHQNVRQHSIKESYLDCFSGVSKVYWLPTYLSREDLSLKILTAQELSGQIKDTKIILAELNEALRTSIRFELQANKIVVVMGAGSIDAWIRENFISKD